MVNHKDDSSAPKTSTWWNGDQVSGVYLDIFWYVWFFSSGASTLRITHMSHSVPFFLLQILITSVSIGGAVVEVMKFWSFFCWRSRCSGTTPPTWSYVFAIVVLETVFWQKGVFEKEHKHLDCTWNGWEWKEREGQVSPPVMQTVWCPLQCGVQSSYIETVGWQFLNTTLQRGKVLHRECGIA